MRARLGSDAVQPTPGKADKRSVTPVLATPGRRFGTYFLDSLISGLLTIPFQVIASVTGLWKEPTSFEPFVLWIVLMTLIYLAMIVYMEGQKGYTPGKWITGLRVVDAGGAGVIGWRRDLARRLMFFPEAIPLYLGLLWILRDERRQAWHDKVAKSIVIDIRQSPGDLQP